MREGENILDASLPFVQSRWLTPNIQLQLRMQPRFISKFVSNHGLSVWSQTLSVFPLPLVHLLLCCYGGK